MRSVVVALAALLLLPGCDDAPPAVEIVGGGFMFNYRHNFFIYGFVADVTGRIPEGTVIEAEMEDPEGGAPSVERMPVRRHVRSYRFQSPPVFGVVKDRGYRASVRLIDPGTARVLAARDKMFRSDLDQEGGPESVTDKGFPPAPAR